MFRSCLFLFVFIKEDFDVGFFSAKKFLGSKSATGIAQSSDSATRRKSITLRKSSAYRQSVARKSISAQSTSAPLLSVSQPTLDYVNQYGISHLVAAGRIDDARAKMLDFDWLVQRRDDIDRLCADAKLVASKVSDKDVFMQRLAIALRLGRREILEYPDALPCQLFGWLMGLSRRGKEIDNPEIAFFLDRIASFDSFEWWKPVAVNWSVSGRPLLGHTGSVWSVSFNHDGSQIVSGSGDNTVRVWDVASVRCLQCVGRGSTESASIMTSGRWLDRNIGTP